MGVRTPAQPQIASFAMWQGVGTTFMGPAAGVRRATLPDLGADTLFFSANCLMAVDGSTEVGRGSWG